MDCFTTNLPPLELQQFAIQIYVAIEMCVAISPVAIAYVVITHVVIYMLQ